MTNQEEVKATDAASWWEDPIDAVISPVALFDRRRTAALGIPILMIVFGAILAYVVLLPVTSMVMEAQAASNPQAAQAMQQYGTVFRLVGAVFAPIGMLLILAWIGLLLWGFGRLFDVRIIYSRALLIAVLAAWVSVIGQILGGVVLMLTGADPGADMMSAISFGVLRFTGSEGIPRTLVPLLGRLDVFALWQAALWAIGISTIYRVPRSRGFLIAACVLVLSALPEVLLALLPQPGAP